MKDLLALIYSTFAWGDDVAEMWTGTLYEHRIELQKLEIEKMLDSGFFKKAERLTEEFVDFLRIAESAYNE